MIQLLLGAITPKPLNMSVGGYICPVGHFCLAGTNIEEKCVPGTYAPVEGHGSCLPCRQGYVCPDYGTIDPLPCPEGNYCPNGTNTNTGIQCPIGTYNPLMNQTSESDCLPCPAGQYCAELGRSSPNGPCYGGYLCRSGAKIPTPNDGVNVPCPVGKYCVNGTFNATLCPPGTIRKDPGAATVDDCLPCDPGKFCGSPGLTIPTGDCLQGFYCPEDAKTRTSEPSSHVCPAGHFCGNGTSTPQGCPPGTYQTSDGLWYCLSCPEGKFCPGNTSFPIPCPSHSFCPNATIAPVSCPNGTYTDTNTNGLSRPDQCNPCPAGSFCQNGVPAANCSGGYLCYQGSDIPNPNDGVRGIICPIGYYCPPGALEKKQCPKGLVINSEGKSSINDCQRCPAGFVCTLDSTVPQPCERGYYCPFNITRQPCREGTYNNETRASDESWCKPCPAGFWCKGEGKTPFPFTKKLMSTIYFHSMHPLTLGG